jgi:hypothetical protein
MLIQAMDKLNSPVDLVMAGPSGDPAFRARVAKGSQVARKCHEGFGS